MRRTKTETIIAALRVLADSIISEGGIASTAIREAAERLEELHARIKSTSPVLPDGSSFCVVALPLPADHWLYAPECTEWDSVRDTSADTPQPILGNDQREAVKAAIRWAIRGATMNGAEPDYDPDALVLNAAYALCGPAQPKLKATP